MGAALKGITSSLTAVGLGGLAMAVALLLVLAVLAIQAGHKHTGQMDVVTADRMQQREEYLNQEMTRLLHKTEQSSGAQEAPLLSELCWLLVWTMSGAMLCWLAWAVMCAFPGCYEEEDNDEQEEVNLNGVGSLAVSTPSPMQEGLPDTCKVLKELVENLLGFCRTLCKMMFMLQMHLAIGEDGTCEAWIAHENIILYRLLVLLQPPPGYSFSLEEDTTGQLLARSSRIRVVLECMCQQEQLLLGNICFLHSTDNELLRDQSSDLLRRLCMDAYLDLEKVASWAQLLVRSAWLYTPQAQQCQLTVLPSSQTCTFRLTDGHLQDDHHDGDDFRSATRQPRPLRELCVGRGQLYQQHTMAGELALLSTCSSSDSRRAHSPDNFHLGGLQLCSHVLEITGFSTHATDPEDFLSSHTGGTQMATLDTGTDTAHPRDCLWSWWRRSEPTSHGDNSVQEELSKTRVWGIFPQPS